MQHPRVLYGRIFLSSWSPKCLSQFLFENSMSFSKEPNAVCGPWVYPGLLIKIKKKKKKLQEHSWDNGET